MSTAQLTASPTVQYFQQLLDKLPFSGAASFGKSQVQAFNRAALARIGVTDAGVTAATPEVLAAAKERIAGVLDAAAEKGVPLTDDMLTNLRSYTSQLGDTVLDSQQSTLLRNVDNLRVAAAKNGGVIPGTIMQQVRSNLGVISKNPGLSEAADNLREIIDEALPPTAEVTQARQQYRMLKQIEGATDLVGNIRPAKLATVLLSKAYRQQTLYGTGDQSLTQLARAARGIVPDQATAAPGRLIPTLALFDLLSIHPYVSAAKLATSAVGGAVIARGLRNVGAVGDRVLSNPTAAAAVAGMPAGATMGAMASQLAPGQQQPGGQ